MIAYAMYCIVNDVSRITKSYFVEWLFDSDHDSSSLNPIHLFISILFTFFIKDEWKNKQIKGKKYVRKVNEACAIIIIV
jgi:hypothetical protein